MFKYISVLLLLLPQICFSYNSSLTNNKLFDLDHSPYLAVLEWLADDNRGFSELYENENLAKLAREYNESDFYRILEEEKRWIRDDILKNNPITEAQVEKKFKLSVRAFGCLDMNIIDKTLGRLLGSDRYEERYERASARANYYAKLAYLKRYHKIEHYSILRFIRGDNPTVTDTYSTEWHKDRMREARKEYRESYDDCMSIW